MKGRVDPVRLVAAVCAATAVLVAIGFAVAPAATRMVLGEASAVMPSWPAASVAPQPYQPSPTVPVPAAGQAQGTLPGPAELVALPPGEPAPVPGPAPTPDLPEDPAPLVRALSTTTATFTISSFNVLGSSHTSARGNKPRMASGAARMGLVTQLLAAHQVDVVGLQEFQTPQLRSFQQRLGSSWSVYPGLALGSRGVENSIAWRAEVWELASPGSISIPYFNGHQRSMPVVLLRHRATGLLAYFANFHNPADTRRFHHQEGFRDRATALEVGLVNRLRSETGLPVFVTGDMNERDDYFCAVTAGAQLVASNGGYNGGGACQPPRPTGIDWIFGSPGVTFSDHLVDRGATVQRASDHAMVLARATITGIPASAG